MTKTTKISFPTKNKFTEYSPDDLDYWFSN